MISISQIELIEGNKKKPNQKKNVIQIKGEPNPAKEKKLLRDQKRREKERFLQLALTTAISTIDKSLLTTTPKFRVIKLHGFKITYKVNHDA